MSKPGTLVFTVYENPEPELSGPVRPPLRLIERDGATVVSLFQEKVGLYVGELLTENRAVGLFVQRIVAGGFRRQDLSGLSQGMDGLRVWVLSPDDEYVHGAHAFEGHLQGLSGRWFVKVAGTKPYKLRPSDTIYVAPSRSSW